jgi:hypothetical protein
MPARPGGLGQQGREPLHPPIDGDVVDLDPALGEQFLDIRMIRYIRRRSPHGTSASRSNTKPIRRPVRDGALTVNI